MSLRGVYVATSTAAGSISPSDNAAKAFPARMPQMIGALSRKRTFAGDSASYEATDVVLARHEHEANKLSLRKCATQFGVPKSTLFDVCKSSASYTPKPACRPKKGVFCLKCASESSEMDHLK